MYCSAALDGRQYTLMRWDASAGWHRRRILYRKAPGRAELSTRVSVSLKRQRERHRLTDKCMAMALQRYAMPTLGMASVVHIYIEKN